MTGQYISALLNNFSPNAGRAFREVLEHAFGHVIGNVRSGILMADCDDDKLFIQAIRAPGVTDEEIERVALFLFSLGIEQSSSNRAISRLGILAWISPRKPLIPLAQGFLNLIHGYYAAARRDFACAIELAPDSALALLGAGLTARHEGRLPAAAQYLLRIIRMPVEKGNAEVQKYAAGVLNELLHRRPAEGVAQPADIVSKSDVIESRQVPYLPGPPVGVIPF